MTVVESASRLRWRRALGRLHPSRAKSGTEKHLPWTVPVLGLVVLMAAAAAVLWATMGWVGRVAALPVEPSKAIGGKDYVAAMLDAMKIALSVVAGGGALLALYLAVRRQRTAERDLQARLDAQAHTENDARSRRVTELYTKAADQLGSDKAPVRLAGLYALERLGQDNTDQRGTIAQLWCAYLRMPYTPPAGTILPVKHPPVIVNGGRPRGMRGRVVKRRPSSDTGTRPDPEAAHTEAVQERDVRLSVQRLLAKHLRPAQDATDHSHQDYWPEIAELDLTEATLINFNMSHCRLPKVGMNRVRFIGVAAFEQVIFTGDAEFDNATFTREPLFVNATFTQEAWFRDVIFARGAWFQGATFIGDALFYDATFSHDAQFYGATFTHDARFADVTFTRVAGFGGATFTCAAWFRGATFTDRAEFGNATFTGNANFGNATFTCDALSGDALVISPASCQRVRVPLTNDAAVMCTWPWGWTLGIADPQGDDDGGVWGRLVPVPEVFDELNGWDGY